MEQITLRNLCEQLQVSRRVIQGYEKAGLLTATGKNKYGYLLYDECAVKRAKFVKFLRETGFSLKEVKNLIKTSDDDFEAALKKKMKELEREKERIDALIAKIQGYINKRN